MKKRTKAIGGAVAAAAAATALIATNPAADKEVNINYDIHPVNEYVSEMMLDVPDELSADIAELYLNRLCSATRTTSRLSFTASASR